MEVLQPTHKVQTVSTSRHATAPPPHKFTSTSLYLTGKISQAIFLSSEFGLCLLSIKICDSQPKGSDWILNKGHTGWSSVETMFIIQNRDGHFYTGVDFTTNKERLSVFKPSRKLRNGYAYALTWLSFRTSSRITASNR